MHELQMKYGVTEFTREWLEGNRSWLNDPEKADDWRKIAKSIDNADAAAVEMEALSQYIEKLVSGGKDMDAIEAELKALIEGGGEVRYTNADGERVTLELSTLARMEEERMLVGRSPYHGMEAHGEEGRQRQRRGGEGTATTAEWRGAVAVEWND